MIKILGDEALEEKEDKSYRVWEKEGGNLGPIRRRLVAQAQLEDTIRQVVEMLKLDHIEGEYRGEYPVWALDDETYRELKKQGGKEG